MVPMRRNSRSTGTQRSVSKAGLGGETRWNSSVCLSPRADRRATADPGQASPAGRRGARTKKDGAARRRCRGSTATRHPIGDRGVRRRYPQGLEAPRPQLPRAVPPYMEARQEDQEQQGSQFIRGVVRAGVVHLATAVKSVSRLRPWRQRGRASRSAFASETGVRA